MDGPLIVIVGPTAVGKSDVALAVAERHGGAILSADAMQVYRGLDRGTSKPSPADRARVAHYLVDIADPRADFSAGTIDEPNLVVTALHEEEGQVMVRGYQLPGDGPARFPAWRIFNMPARELLVSENP